MPSPIPKGEDEKEGEMNSIGALHNCANAHASASRLRIQCKLNHDVWEAESTRKTQRIRMSYCERKLNAAGPWIRPSV